MTTDPEWAEVVRWMARNGGASTGRAPAIEAARHFFPGLPPEEQDRLAAKYRVWWGRYRDRVVDSEEPRAQGAQRAAPPGPPPPPTVDLTKLSPVERLEWQLASLTASYEQAMGRGDTRGASMVDARITDVGERLDVARATAARVLKLDRTAGGNAAALLRKAKAIQLRAEMERRRAEREGTPKEG